MNAFTKLTVAALTAAGIAGGVAVAQTNNPVNDNPNASADGRDSTANYGTPPGAPLKRDGSLQGDAVVRPADTGAAMSTDTSTTTTSTTDASSTAAMPAAAAAAPADTSSNDTSDASLQPRADRN